MPRIQKITEREKFIYDKHLEGYTMREISILLDVEGFSKVSHQRVCQVLERTKAKLKANANSKP